MSPKRQRLWFVIFSVVCLCAATLLILNVFRQNIVFFFSPTELAERHIPPGQPIRIGGLVKKGSVLHDSPAQVPVYDADIYNQFIVTDGAADITVRYNGLLPNLFREGQGVVVEGSLNDKQEFIATRVLAKHDENYMPREVVDALKKSGRWQEKK